MTIAAAILESMNIDQAIQEQDEVDKKGISLMGVKQEDRKNDILPDYDSKSRERTSQKVLKPNASVGSNLGSPNTSIKAKINAYTKRRFTTMKNNQKGMNEETGAQNAQVKLHKQCLTCSGNAAVVLNAFKIACLAYSPSTVGYRSNIFSREYLLALKKHIVQSYWSHCYNRPPFTENQDVSVDLIYENTFVAMSKQGNTIPAINMHEPAILTEDNTQGHMSVRASSRNKNAFNNTNLLKNYQTSSNFLATQQNNPVLGTDRSDVNLTRTNYGGYNVQKEEESKK